MIPLPPPQVSLLPAGPTSQTARLMMRFALDARKDYRVRELAESITSRIADRDQLSEALACYYWVLMNVRYLNSQWGIELQRDPGNLLRPLPNGGTHQGDCFPAGTLLLRDDFSLAPIEHIRVGDRVWGLDRWVTVTAKADRGDRPIWIMRANNGAHVPLSPDHHVFVGRCKHTKDACGCTIEKTGLDRIQLSAVEPGDLLPQPGRLPYGTRQQDPEEAWVEGAYIADGWHEGYRVGISGKDGHPKEQQKKRVKEFCEEREIPFRWHERYIALNDQATADRLLACGVGAPNKRARTLDLEEGAAMNLLRGIMADGGVNAQTGIPFFSSTSKLLAIQVRVLHLMAGIHCSGGYLADPSIYPSTFGRLPVWRLSMRMSAKKRLRVKEVVDTGQHQPCWDIQTEDGYVWLPEHDITVSNCNEMGPLLAALLMCLGREVRFVTVGFDDSGEHSHTFPEVLIGGRWLCLDPVANTRTGSMLRRVRGATPFYANDV